MGNRESHHNGEKMVGRGLLAAAASAARCGRH